MRGARLIVKDELVRVKQCRRIRRKPTDAKVGDIVLQLDGYVKRALGNDNHRQLALLQRRKLCAILGLLTETSNTDKIGRLECRAPRFSGQLGLVSRVQNDGLSKGHAHGYCLRVDMAHRRIDTLDARIGYNANVGPNYCIGRKH